MQRREASRKLAIGVARALGAFVILVVLYYLMPIGDPSKVGVALRVMVSGALIVTVVWWEIRAVARSALPMVRAIQALAVCVSVIVVAFAAAYLVLSHDDPAAFNERLGKTSSLYFTVTTLATVGYGDIHARTDTARVTVMVQMIANVAVLGASVRLILATARRRSVEGSSGP